MATIKHKGKIVLERDVPFWTPEMIREAMSKKVGADRRIALTRGTELRPLEQFHAGKDLGTEVIVKDFPAATGKGADESPRSRYIKAQVASVAEVYGERFGQPVQLAADLQFCVIPQFTLPKQWGLKSTPILIWFPDNYPIEAPCGFYLSKKCNGPHIFSTNVYSKSPNLSHLGWNWYCAHTAWKPGSDPLEGDTLWTFLDICRLSLTVKEF